MYFKFLTEYFGNSKKKLTYHEVLINATSVYQKLNLSFSWFFRNKYPELAKVIGG